MSEPQRFPATKAQVALFVQANQEVLEAQRNARLLVSMFLAQHELAPEQWHILEVGDEHVTAIKVEKTETSK